MKASMPEMRSVSTTSQGEGTRFIRNSTSRMWPVRPMPPTVARNSSLGRRRLAGARPGAALDDAAVGHAQAQGGDVGAEAAVPVVVVAVDVRRHHPAQGHELGARRDGQEEPAGQEEAVQLEHAQARLGAQEAGLGIEGEDAVGEGGVGGLRPAGGRQRRVAVGAAEAARQHRVAR